MINAEITSTLPEPKAFDLRTELDSIGRYKQEYLRASIRQAFATSSGKLAESIQYEVGENEVEWSSALPYSAVQLTPGEKFIPGRNVTVIRHLMGKRMKSPAPGALRGEFSRTTAYTTYQMARYFWARWFETQDEKWARMALHVHKYGGVTVEGKPIMQWEPEDIEYITNRLAGYVVSFFGTKGEQVA